MEKMSQLFYANLEDVPDTKLIERRAVTNLLEFYNYLENAIRFLLNCTRSTKWKRLDPNNLAREIVMEALSEYNLNIVVQNQDIIVSVNENDSESENEYRNPVHIEKVRTEIRNRIFPQKPGEKKIWLEIIPPEENESNLVENEFFEAENVYQNYDRKYDEKFDPPRLAKNRKTYRVLDVIQEYNALCVDEELLGNQLLFSQPNIYTLDRQKNALLDLQSRPQKHHRALLRLVEKKEVVRFPQFTPIEVHEWIKLTDLSYPDTPVQREFVKIALGTPDFAFLEGPPGSGKTFTICELVLQLVRARKRVILVASTHVAVDNVLEQLVDHQNEVIAVRIGKKDDVSEKIKPFRLEEKIKSERERILKKLLSIKNPSPSQKHFIAALQTKQNKIVNNIILNSANLICGTTIGILKHPDFRKSQSRIIKPFDLLILDEASKITFTEFLVPALYAKKWIIVGDIRQLAPYVEESEVRSNLNACLETPEDCIICSDLFHIKQNIDQWEQIFKQSFKKVRTQKKLWRESPNPLYKLLVIDEDPSILERYEQQAKLQGIPVINFNKIKNPPQNFELQVLSCAVYLGTRTDIQKYESLLPADINLIRGGNYFPNFEKRRLAYYKNAKESKNNEKSDQQSSLFENLILEIEALPNWLKTTDPDSDFSKSWAEEISWRLIRAFETKNSSDPATQEKNSLYWSQINNQLPKYYDANKTYKINDQLDLVSRVAFPSILELLQVGFKKRSGAFIESSLSSGIPSEAFEKRHLVLKHQNRMHPAIADFPRKTFYKDLDALKIPPKLEQDRLWSYPNYKYRCVWETYQNPPPSKRNRNLEEVKIIQRQLDEFRIWTSRNPHPKNPGGFWEVAVLTFYRGQEAELRSMLRKLFKTGGHYNFRSKPHRIHVQLCTVDRFQGHEADLVFLSFVRTRGIGFLDNPNRLNVALTRAKYQLVLVGYLENFKRKKSPEILRKLAEEIPSSYSLTKITLTGGDRHGSYRN